MTSRSARSFIAHLFARWLWGVSLVFCIFICPVLPDLSMVFGKCVTDAALTYMCARLSSFNDVKLCKTAVLLSPQVSDLNGKQGHF